MFPSLGLKDAKTKNGESDMKDKSCPTYTDRQTIIPH